MCINLGYNIEQDLTTFLNASLRAGWRRVELDQLEKELKTRPQTQELLAMLGFIAALKYKVDAQPSPPISKDEKQTWEINGVD